MSSDRLTGLDASFLHLEDAVSHMHVAGVMIFEGSPPPYDELYLHVLEARSAYVGGEIDRYNNATALLQNLWEAYARSYIRSHRPARRELNYLGGDRI